MYGAQSSTGVFLCHLRAKPGHLTKNHALSESFGKKSTVEPGITTSVYATP